MICGPLVCRLCNEDFISERSFVDHQKSCHGGESECRKRVVYLLTQDGYRPITGQEKRLMVQNFAHFQQYCNPGAKGNYFADGAEVPRCEAACAICARKDFLENRHKLHLLAETPTNTTSETANAENATENSDEEVDPSATTLSTRALRKHRGIYYLQSPDQVHQLLDVKRYSQRWPLISAEELHVSSIQHPYHPEWRWLLHHTSRPCPR